MWDSTESILLGCNITWLDVFSAKKARHCCEFWSSPSCKPASPHIDSIYNLCYRWKTANVIKDQSILFSPLPSASRYKCLKSNDTRFWISFFPAGIRPLNGPLINYGCSPNLPIYHVATIALFFICTL